LPAANLEAASPKICLWGNVIKEILFYVGFLLIILLFSEEFARAGQWLRAHLKQYPQHRIIVYPLVLALMAAAGFIIVRSLIYFATGLLFSYE
jgi:hypothetical protein